MQNVGVDWMDGWMDTPKTVTTTRAPAVLKQTKKSDKKQIGGRPCY